MESFFLSKLGKNNLLIPSKILILENEIILSGFLNQHLINYLKEKFFLCVDEANNDEKNYLSKNRRFESREIRRRKRKI